MKDTLEVADAPAGGWKAGITGITEHRPWALPSGRWIMSQVWHDLLFAHWPIAPEVLRRLMPNGLELDTFEGHAWVGVVPFHMSGIALRGLPSAPVASRFAELNVRTYVVKDNKPGVFFFCLDAASPIAVATARVWYHLPYFNARMSVKIGPHSIEYKSQRTHRGANPAQFEATYGPLAAICPTQPGSLEHWLTERYALYAVHRERVYRGEIHHRPWPLQPAQADIRCNTMAQAHGITLPSTPPLLHYSRRLEVVAWPLQVVK